MQPHTFVFTPDNEPLWSQAKQRHAQYKSMCVNCSAGHFVLYHSLSANSTKQKRGCPANYGKLFLVATCGSQRHLGGSTAPEFNCNTTVLRAAKKNRVPDSCFWHTCYRISSWTIFVPVSTLRESSSSLVVAAGHINTAGKIRGWYFLHSLNDLHLVERRPLSPSRPKIKMKAVILFRAM